MKSSPEMSPAADLACQWAGCTDAFMDPTDLYVCLLTEIVRLTCVGSFMRGAYWPQIHKQFVLDLQLGELFHQDLEARSHHESHPRAHSS
jgi:hypothetical protein